jgi:hypothetical protein
MRNRVGKREDGYGQGLAKARLLSELMRSQKERRYPVTQLHDG